MKKIWNAAFEIADFAAHFYKLSDEEILKDIKEGIDLSISRKMPESGSCFLAKCILDAENKMKKISDINRENINSRWKVKDAKPSPKPKRPPNVSPDGEVIEPFVPPTIEQVQSLCVEKRYPDPQGLAVRFFDFYTPDWVTGKGKKAKPMDSWPKALAGWVARDHGNFRVPEFADIKKYLVENCERAGLDIDFVAAQFLNKGEKEGWKNIRDWVPMLKQYVNTIVCSQSNKK